MQIYIFNGIWARNLFHRKLVPWTGQWWAVFQSLIYMYPRYTYKCSIYQQQIGNRFNVFIQIL